MPGDKNPTIDQKLILADLLDIDLLRDILNRFGRFTGLRIRVTDERMNTFLTEGDVPRFCMFVKGNDAGKRQCEDAAIECAWIPLESRRPHIYNCFCGLNYAVILLASEFDQVGRAVFGPFKTNETVAARNAFDQSVTKSQIDFSVEKVPLRDLDTVNNFTQLFSDVMDVFLFLSAKRLLTSRLHLETIYRAREELFREMEDKMKNREDREEIERLKQIF